MGFVRPLILYITVWSAIAAATPSSEVVAPANDPGAFEAKDDSAFARILQLLGFRGASSANLDTNNAVVLQPPQPVVFGGANQPSPYVDICPFDSIPFVRNPVARAFEDIYLLCNPRDLRACPEGYSCDRSRKREYHVCCSEKSIYHPTPGGRWPEWQTTWSSTNGPPDGKQPHNSRSENEHRNASIPISTPAATTATIQQETTTTAPTSTIMPPTTTTTSTTTETTTSTTTMWLPPNPWGQPNPHTTWPPQPTWNPNPWNPNPNPWTPPAPWSPWGQTTAPPTNRPQSWTPWQPQETTPQRRPEEDRNTPPTHWPWETTTTASTHHPTWPWQRSTTPEPYRPGQPYNPSQGFRSLSGGPGPQVYVVTTGRAVKLTREDFDWATTITLVRDEDRYIMVDTGVPSDTTEIIKGLAKYNLRPESIDIVMITHGHPDHFGNQNLFARKPQLFDIYEFVGNRFTETQLKQAQYRKLTTNTEVWKTPGHTTDDISLIVKNVQGNGTIAIVGDLIPSEDFVQNPQGFPAETSWNRNIQIENMNAVLCAADYIVPGHGAVFPVRPEYRVKANCAPKPSFEHQAFPPQGYYQANSQPYYPQYPMQVPYNIKRRT